MKSIKAPSTAPAHNGKATQKGPFGRRVAKVEIVFFYTSFTDEVDKRDHLATEWRRYHARSTAPVSKRGGG